MSSISRARSSASAQAAAGVWATSGAPLAPCTSGDAAHFVIELRQQQAPLEAAERFRQGQRVGRDVAGRGFGERDLVLVDIADGDDARQDRRVVARTSRKASRASRQARRVGR